jgi:N-acetylglucosamine-6-phosphate deacetylase
MPEPMMLCVPEDGWLLPDMVFDGRHLHQRAAIRIESGRIAAIANQQHAPAGGLILEGIVSPGFVDLQVNGGGGVLFNTSPDVAGLRAIAAAHRRGGTARLLPTVITDTPEVLEQACDAVIAAFDRDGIAGIHIEGPHINIKRRGTHQAASIRPYDAATDRQITRLRDADVPVMITLAPECQPKGTVARLVERGVIVALGHSAATYAEALAAIDEGAQTFTHLMNAMPPIENRNPGIVGAALNAQTYCSVIFDGIHVVPDMLRIILNARHHTGRIIAVTDAMPTLFGPDRFTLYDGVEVRLQDGQLINPEGGLAGAHVTMLQSLAMLAGPLGVSLEEALKSVITHPCDLMGFSPELIGQPADGCLTIAADLGHCTFLSRPVLSDDPKQSRKEPALAGFHAAKS